MVTAPSGLNSNRWPYLAASIMVLRSVSVMVGGRDLVNASALIEACYWV